MQLLFQSARERQSGWGVAADLRTWAGAVQREATWREKPRGHERCGTKDNRGASSVTLLTEVPTLWEMKLIKGLPNYNSFKDNLPKHILLQFSHLCCSLTVRWGHSEPNQTAHGFSLSPHFRIPSIRLTCKPIVRDPTHTALSACCRQGGGCRLFRPGPAAWRAASSTRPPESSTLSQLLPSLPIFPQCLFIFVFWI